MPLLTELFTFTVPFSYIDYAPTEPVFECDWIWPRAARFSIRQLPD